MAVVIVGCLITAVMLACQGIYALRTGQSNWFFARHIHSHAEMRPPLRIAYGLVCLVPAIGIVIILATALIKRGIEPVQSWVVSNLGMLFFSLFFLVIGLRLLVQPEKMLPWTIRANREVANSQAMLITTRVVGAGLFGMGLAILARL